MSEYITRADFWQETIDTEGVVPAGCPTRVEAQDGTAWEDVSKHDRLIGGWLRTRRVFVDSRWNPPVQPLKVGATVTTKEQLDALPNLSVILSMDGQAWQLDIFDGIRTWYATFLERGFPSGSIASRFGPFTLLWLPEGADQ